MCKFASFVLTRDREFWLPDEDSHEAIIEHFALHADGPRGPNFVRVEISPGSNLLRFDDYAGWTYRLDEDLTPDWFDAVEAEQRTRAALLRRAAQGFRTVDARGCTALTELKADAAETVDASGCTALTELKADAARYVYARGCTALTELKADAARYVDASGCTALTELKADAARYVYARGCTALTELKADAAETVDARDCTALRRKPGARH